MRKGIIGAGIAALLVGGWLYERSGRHQDARLPMRGGLIDAGGYRIRVYEEGEGSPAVVIVRGAGDCAASWTAVQHDLDRVTRATSYDGAGIGGSEDGPPRNVDRYLSELAAVLEQTATPKPVVLVGHSLGGLIVQLYAQRHPDQVAGLVLVDATPEAVAGDPGVRAGFIAVGAMAAIFKLLAPLGLTRLLLALNRMPLYPEQPIFRTAVSAEEYRRWIASVCRDYAGGSGDELRSAWAAVNEAARLRKGVSDPQFGDLPLAVLSSHAFGDKLIEMRRQFLQRSTNSRFILTDTNAHNIHMRHRATVVRAVEEVMEEAQRLHRADLRSPDERRRPSGGEPTAG